MSKILLIVFTFIFSNSLVAGECSSFTVFDGTQYKNKSDEVMEYLTPLTIIYGHRMYPNNKHTKKLPPLDYAYKKVLKQLNKNADVIVYDIEHWPIRGFYRRPWKRESAVNKYDDIMSHVSTWFPDKTIGFFGMFPLNDYVGISGARDSQRFKWWQEDNEATRKLIKHGDFIAPSFYTYNKNFEQWKLVSKRKVEAARSLDKDIPIIAFVWPQYTEKKPTPKELRNKLIPSEQWLKQLESLEEMVDGLVIWGGYDLVKKGPMEWDNDAEWWSATKEFINRIEKDECTTQP